MDVLKACMCYIQKPLFDWTYKIICTQYFKTWILTWIWLICWLKLNDAQNVDIYLLTTIFPTLTSKIKHLECHINPQILRQLIFLKPLDMKSLHLEYDMNFIIQCTIVVKLKIPKT